MCNFQRWRRALAASSSSAQAAALADDIVGFVVQSAEATVSTRVTREIASSRGRRCHSAHTH